MKDVLTETKISALFFKKIDDPLFSNDKCYLPPELQYHVSIFIFHLCNSIANLMYKFYKMILLPGRKIYHEEDVECFELREKRGCKIQTRKYRLSGCSR